MDFQFGSTLRLDVPIVLQTLIQMVWPAPLHLTLSSSFMLWAELLGPSERDVQLLERRLQWKFKCTLEIWLKCAWVLIWIQWTTFRVSLCLEFNMLPPPDKVLQLTWSEGEAWRIVSINTLRFCNLRVVRLWYERPQLLNPVVDVVSSPSFNYASRTKKKR